VEAVTYAMKANNANNAATLHGCEGKLVADDIRALILEPFVCYYCSAPLSHQKGDPGSSQIWQIDHVIPMTKQGPNTRENIVACCRSCNQAKGNKIVEKY
jgi:5-methylcytosine-specific restriction endonuclease McrA